MSRTKAINDKCKDCSYDSEDKGSWRYQVLMCKCRNCPLYQYRPLPTGMKYQDAAYKAATGELRHVPYKLDL